MCWNAGGGAGTLKDDDKLRFLTLTMLQQHIHVACLTEGKASYKDLQAALKRIGMGAHFRAEGKNGTVAWLVQTPVADKIVGRLEYEGGRIAGLVLAGSCHQRTVILGVYGYAGSSTEMQSTLLQRVLWRQLRQIIVANQEKKHNIVVLGDLNVLPGAEFTSSLRPLPTAVTRAGSGFSGSFVSGFPTARLGFTLRRGHEALATEHLSTKGTWVPPFLGLVCLSIRV